MSDVTTELAMEASDKAMQIARLRAENAKLREEFNKMDVWHSKELTAAMADNAKLRELVRHMHTCMEHYEMDGTISCDRCPLDNCVGNCDYERRMRELGVEVVDE